jgi:hypothetical protein
MIEALKRGNNGLMGVALFRREYNGGKIKNFLFNHTDLLSKWEFTYWTCVYYSCG